MFWITRGNRKTQLEISFQWNAPLTLDTKTRLKNIFRSAWLGQERYDGFSLNGPYKHLTKNDLGIDNSKRQFIDTAVKDEFENWEKQNNPYLFVYVAGQLVGFISLDAPKFNEKNSRFEIYIRQLAIASPYKRFGLGSSLVQCIQQRYPSTHYTYLLTRRVNKPSIEFYKHLGFRAKRTLTHGEYNPTTYVGMERKLLPLYN